jgi:3-dehydroquinate dehydratase / shikimate dehydrogenase
VVKVRNKRMLILGAGGAARAIAYEASHRGARVMVANRSETKARRLAREFGFEHVKISTLQDLSFDILVNATSVGMVPHMDESPVPKSILKGKIVFDVVYNPSMTKLLKEAKSVGAKIIRGTEMYLNQAALQSWLFVGVRPNKITMRNLLTKGMMDSSPNRSRQAKLVW